MASFKLIAHLIFRGKFKIPIPVKNLTTVQVNNFFPIQFLSKNEIKLVRDFGFAVRLTY